MPTGSFQTIGAWRLQRVGRNIWKMYLQTGSGCVTFDGAGNAALSFSIPYPHRFLRLHFSQITTANAASWLPWSCQVSRPLSTSTPASINEYIVKFDNEPVHTFTCVKGDGWEYEACVWDVTLTGTATNKVVPIFYLQILDGASDHE